MKTAEEMIRFVAGLAKKHGPDFEIVVKYQNDAGKVRRQHGRFVGWRPNPDVPEAIGLHNADKGRETWFALDQIVDVWKRGAHSG